MKISAPARILDNETLDIFLTKYKSIKTESFKRNISHRWKHFETEGERGIKREYPINFKLLREKLI